jgi:ABC-type iron transport system FetAB permease component
MTKKFLGIPILGLPVLIIIGFVALYISSNVCPPPIADFVTNKICDAFRSTGFSGELEWLTIIFNVLISTSLAYVGIVHISRDRGSRRGWVFLMASIAYLVMLWFVVMETTHSAMPMLYPTSDPGSFQDQL